jgi:hypothetical protein
VNAVPTSRSFVAALLRMTEEERAPPDDRELLKLTMTIVTDAVASLRYRSKRAVVPRSPGSIVPLISADASRSVSSRKGPSLSTPSG